MTKRRSPISPTQYNPYNVALPELPFVMGCRYVKRAYAISEAGFILAQFPAAQNRTAIARLGVYETGDLAPHGAYRLHYPAGYRMRFLPQEAIHLDSIMLIAIRLADLAGRPLPFTFNTTNARSTDYAVTRNRLPNLPLTLE